jgi:hypothetical protein
MQTSIKFSGLPYPLASPIARWDACIPCRFHLGFIWVCYIKYNYNVDFERAHRIGNDIKDWCSIQLSVRMQWFCLTPRNPRLHSDGMLAVGIGPWRFARVPLSFPHTCPVYRTPCTYVLRRYTLHSLRLWTSGHGADSPVVNNVAQPPRVSKV